MNWPVSKEYYQFPDSLKTEFKAIPWLQFLVYIPFFLQPFDIETLFIVLVCHAIIFSISFKVYWLEDNQVIFPFLLALTLSFFTSFYSVSSIALYAITILVAMAHSMFRIRLLLVLVVVCVYLLSAWLQKYDAFIFLIGLFFTLVNGISVCYQIQALYKQLAIKQDQEEVRTLATSTERERIAHDLHDVLGQSLTGISLKAELALRTLEKSPSVAKQQLSDIIDISRNTLTEVREAVSDYRKTTIENEVASARIAFGAINIKFKSDIEPISLETPIEQALAWVIREATTNVMRHSKANLCQVILKTNKKILTLVISDDGIGGANKPDDLGNTFGTGIVSIRQRCNTIDAKFQLAQTNGYTITVIKELT